MLTTPLAALPPQIVPPGPLLILQFVHVGKNIVNVAQYVPPYTGLNKLRPSIITSIFRCIIHHESHEDTNHEVSLNLVTLRPGTSFQRFRKWS